VIDATYTAHQHQLDVLLEKGRFDKEIAAAHVWAAREVFQKAYGCFKSFAISLEFVYLVLLYCCLLLLLLFIINDLFNFFVFDHFFDMRIVVFGVLH